MIQDKAIEELLREPHSEFDKAVYTEMVPYELWLTRDKDTEFYYFNNL